MSRYSRRSVLRTTGGMAGTVAVASVAGCSSIPFLGDGDASYAQWLYEPGTLTDEDHYSFYFLKTDPIENNEDEFSEDTYSGLSSPGSFVETIDLDFDDLSTYLSFQQSKVITGDYAVDDVEGELEDAGYSDDDEVGSYTVWVNEDEASAYGVSGSDVVYGTAGFTGDTDPVEVVETTIETKRGNEDRYRSENDDFGTVTNKVGSGHIVTAGTQEETEETNVENGEFAGQVARATRFNFNGSTSKLKGVFLFADADDIDMGDVEDYVEQQQEEGSGGLAEANSVDTSKSGRAVVITVDVDTDEI